MKRFVNSNVCLSSFENIKNTLIINIYFELCRKFYLYIEIQQKMN